MGLALLVLVDAVYYWEYRTRLFVRTHFEGWLSFARWGSTRSIRTSMSLSSPLFSMVFLIAMTCVGFDLLWLVATRMFISLYQAMIHLSWLPRLPWRGWLLMGRSNPEVDVSLQRQTDFGGMFRVWGRLFNSAGAKGQR
jgi:hypothetical protein